MEGSLLLAIPFFLAGASIGSFLNVVADRLPAGQSLVRPRSACPACSHELSNLDLIPIQAGDFHDDFVVVRGFEEIDGRDPVGTSGQTIELLLM